MIEHIMFDSIVKQKVVLFVILVILVSFYLKVRIIAKSYNRPHPAGYYQSHFHQTATIETVTNRLMAKLNIIIFKNLKYFKYKML